MESLFGKTVNSVRKVDYMIDLSYGKKDWDMAAALREIIANAIDTKEAYSYKYEKGIATITDQGTGLPKKAFVMGASSKSDDATSIGQFGEGLKMCLVTALRYGNRVSIATVGYGVETEAVHSDEYGTDMMRIHFTDNAISTGTEIRVECTKEEYDRALEMFLQFRSGYKKLERSLYLPGGFLSILGLTTEERPNLLFSYDLNDKSLTNRDRNTVKTKKLKVEMERILSGIRNKETIRLFFEGLKEHPESEEYKITFTPKHADKWQETVADLYGDTAVFSTTSEADIKAVYMGLKVIPCPTKAVRKLLEEIGVKSSAQKTKRLAANKVQLKNEDENKITYPIARNYVEKWTVLDAGREILANALDASGQNADISYENGYFVINDTGTGISKKHFVIGNSNKADEQIGLFGEGLKLAALVMAREHRDMVIETIGYTYRPALEQSEEFGTEVFCIRYEKNVRKQGTAVRFKATKRETEKIKALFICFQEQKEPAYTTPEMELYEIPEGGKGEIYVNGLQTCETNSIYSYNVKDRNLVNSRDRNMVDEEKLNGLLTGFYNKVSDPAVIRKLLTAWQDNPLCREYSLIFEPELPMFWYNEVDNCFQNCCIASMGNWRNNFIAASAGYHILENVPPYILKVISNSLKTADEIAGEYGDSGIFLDNRILYPITDEYLPDWGMEDACTEFISNAVDTGKFVRADFEDGKVVIEDNGTGLKEQNFLIGNSSSNGIGKAIGAFGEGLKLACLVAARGNKDGVKIETTGFTATAKLQTDQRFHDAKLLCIGLEKTDTGRKGTRITFGASKTALAASKSRFLAMDKDKARIDDGIWEDKNGKNGIYVNGVRILSTNSIFSYNLTGVFMKQNLSRDRNSFKAMRDANRAVFSLLSDTSKDEVVKKVLTGLQAERYENTVFMENVHFISAKARKGWRKAAMELYPDQYLRGNASEELVLKAKDAGIKILEVDYWIGQILQCIGFPTVSEALKKQEKTEMSIIKPSELSPAERQRYDAMMEIAANEYGQAIAKKIKVAKNMPDTEEGHITLGMYSSFHDMIYLYHGLFGTKYTMSDLLGVMDHEYQHRASGAGDRSRGFENALTKRIGRLLEEKYNPADIKLAV